MRRLPAALRAAVCTVRGVARTHAMKRRSRGSDRIGLVPLVFSYTANVRDFAIGYSGNLS